MKINISEFLSIRFAELELSKGINVLAGKNGAGKSQLFLGIVSTARNGENSLHQYGYGDRTRCGGTVTVNPAPQRPLWRPPVRPIAQAQREADFATLANLASMINPVELTGYTYSLDARFSQLHNRICNMYVAGEIKNASALEFERWATIVKSFGTVFGKELCGEYT